MAETQSFYTAKRKGNEREITLKNYVGLVGKAPTKEKRLKLKIEMMLSGKKMGGTPEWIANAYEFISKNHEKITSDVKFKGYEITFSSDNLFGEKTVKLARANMLGFMFSEVGDSESPDIAMTFNIYVAFTNSLNTWIGQMNGEEFWAKFVPLEEENSATESSNGAQLKLVSKDSSPAKESEDSEQDDTQDDDDEDEEDD